jgi:hypothetical protein
MGEICKTDDEAKPDLAKRPIVDLHVDCDEAKSKRNKPCVYIMNENDCELSNKGNLCKKAKYETTNKQKYSSSESVLRDSKCENPIRLTSKSASCLNAAMDAYKVSTPPKANDCRIIVQQVLDSIINQIRLRGVQSPKRLTKRRSLNSTDKEPASLRHSAFSTSLPHVHDNFQSKLDLPEWF